MKVASGLASGDRADPALAESAVCTALAEAGLRRAEQVILFLSREFSHQPQAALVAAARAAGTMQLCGCTASGLFTERGWQIDRPAAAALVLSSENAGTGGKDDCPTLSFSGHSTLPFAWQSDTQRVGLLDTNAATWAHGRQAVDGCADICLPGLRGKVALSTGLRQLGKAQRIETSHGYELRKLGGSSAADSLRRALPAELRQYPPLHQIVALHQPGEPGIAIVAAHADGSLTLSSALTEGQSITWAIRQPLSSEQDMQKTLLAAVNTEKPPDFGLMFSCIGRGPLFYGCDDLDLLAFRQQFPSTPLLGAYGSGQIAPVAGKNHLFQNSAVTLLFESNHV